MSLAETNLLLLGGDHPSTWIVYNELVARYGAFPAVIEKRVSPLKLIMNRIRKIGVRAVTSQLAFLTLLRPWLRRFSRQRVGVILREHGLEASRPLSDAIFDIDSVNGADCHALIKAFNPKVIVVNGTRILSRKTLDQISGTVLNTHQGITPAYRGSHGAYWALFQGDDGNCGVTIHLVDAGIDTGNIVAQARITPAASDNFVTYSFLQMAAALEPLVNAIEKALAGSLTSAPVSGVSKVWYHPGLFEYLRGAWNGVR